MSKPMPFAKIRLSLMFAAEHELPIELGTDEVWSVLNKLDQLSAETGKAIARAEAAERELAELQAASSNLVCELSDFLLVEWSDGGIPRTLSESIKRKRDALRDLLPTPPQEAE